jgi:hypothetical protein
LKIWVAVRLGWEEGSFANILSIHPLLKNFVFVSKTFAVLICGFAAVLLGIFLEADSMRSRIVRI